MNRFLSTFTALFLLSAIAGCASSEPQQPDDQQASLTGAEVEESSSDNEAQPETEAKSEPPERLPEGHLEQLQILRSQIEDCRAGNAEQCASLAYRYAAGKRVPLDPDAAVEFGELTCEHGTASACENLAYRLVVFEGVASFSAQQLETHCDQSGNAQACAVLAGMYVEGRGVERSPQKAAQIARPPCEGGSNLACNAMIRAVQKTSPGSRPWTLEANKKLLEELCTNNNQAACLALGDLYTEGATWGSESIAKDEKRAEKYYEKVNVPTEEDARVTVYSKPKGEIVVDGQATGEMTPGTVAVTPGKRTVTVQFVDGAESEEKVVRAREGSRIKLFYREKSD